MEVSALTTKELTSLMNSPEKWYYRDISGYEKGGCRMGRGCMDQIFASRIISRLQLEKIKYYFIIFIDVEDTGVN